MDRNPEHAAQRAAGGPLMPGQPRDQRGAGNEQKARGAQPLASAMRMGAVGGS